MRPTGRNIASLSAHPLQALANEQLQPIARPQETPKRPRRIPLQKLQYFSLRDTVLQLTPPTRTKSCVPGGEDSRQKSFGQVLEHRQHVVIPFPRANSGSSSAAGAIDGVSARRWIRRSLYIPVATTLQVTSQGEKIRNTLQVQLRNDVPFTATSIFS